MTVKQEIIAWVEQSEDEELLQAVRDWLVGGASGQDGDLLERLSEEQRLALEKSYQQAQDSEALLSNVEVKSRLKEWL